MKLVVSGGGTGGHIYPALTIAQEVAKLSHPCEILFIGTPDGLESDIVPREGFLFKTIKVHGLKRQMSFENVKILFEAASSVLSSMRILKSFKPDVVVGTGGFVCGPVLLAASLLKIPSLIQEQNAAAGITNKILARFVDKISLGYQEATPYFSAQKEKLTVTGNPIRREVLSAKRETSFKSLGLNPDKLTLLVSGGSRGAKSINHAMLEIYKSQYFVEKSNIQVLHLTGQSGYNNIVGNIKQIGIDRPSLGNIIIKPYLYNMPEALAVADLAVFRAGALTLAELTARGIPAILIPYPYAAENHQDFNAKALEEKGAAVIIKDSLLSGSVLAQTLSGLLDNPAKLKEMSTQSLRLGRPRAAEDIAGLVVSLGRRGSNVK